MAISGVGQSYYQNNAAATKSTKSINGAEEFALEKTSGQKDRKKELMEEYLDKGLSGL